jgi:antitoxin (DNA-binding transcriptional repressor) of toxin-antitoxin stability system
MTNMVMSLFRMAVMKRVDISVLKAQLSAHIQLVRKGEEVLICDRNKPVARIIPCSSKNYAEQQRRLVARGTLVPPRRRPGPGIVSWPMPPGNVADEAIEQIWRQEREGR